MNNKGISDFLKSLRSAKGYTQQQVADLLYISPKTVSKWESGDGIPDISLISAVADVYGVSVDEILRGKKALENSTYTKHQPKKVGAVVKSNLLKRYSMYIYIGVAINVLLIIVGIIIISTTSVYLGIGINFIGTIINAVIIYLGYLDYKHSIRFEEDTYIIKMHKDVKLMIDKKAYVAALINTVLFVVFSYFMTVINTYYVISGIESYIFYILSSVIIIYPFSAVWKIIHEKDLKAKQQHQRTMVFVIKSYLMFMIACYGVVFLLNNSYHDTAYGFSFIIPEITPLHVSLFLQDPLGQNLFRRLFVGGLSIYIVLFVTTYFKVKYRKIMGLAGFILIILSWLIFIDVNYIDNLGTLFTLHTFIWLFMLILISIKPKAKSLDLS